MDPALLDMCKQTVTVETPGDPDGFGGTGYSPPAPYPARVKAEAKLVRAPDGAEKVSSTVAWIPGPPDGPEVIPPLARITLPDGAQPPVLTVGTMPDETGAVDHHKVRFA